MNGGKLLVQRVKKQQKLKSKVYVDWGKGVAIVLFNDSPSSLSRANLTDLLAIKIILSDEVVVGTELGSVWVVAGPAPVPMDDGINDAASTVIRRTFGQSCLGTMLFHSGCDPGKDARDV